MVRLAKLYQRIINSQKNVKFTDLLTLIESFGFELDRIKGSHHIYKHSEIAQVLISLQPTKDKQAKPYQIKQFLALVEEYNLSMRTSTKDTVEDNDDTEEMDS